MPQNYYTHHW